MKTLSVIFENGKIMKFPARCVFRFSMTYIRGNTEFILYLEKEEDTNSLQSVDAFSNGDICIIIKEG